MNPLLKLGATVLGVIVKIASKDDSTGNVVDGLFQIAEIAENDFFTKRNIDRTSQEITDSIARSCYQIMNHHQVSEERANVFYEHVIETVNGSELTYESVIAQKASVDAIYHRMLNVAGKYEKDFDSNEYDIFLRIIRHVAGIIVNTALESPRFVNHGINHIASAIEELQQKTDGVLKRLEEIDQAVSRKTTDFQRFERYYRNNIAEKYGWINLLGAKSLDREEKRYKLSIAYVALELRKGNTTSGHLDVEDLFSKSKFIWIDGEAGSGKSTLMQWIAINSASNSCDVLPDLKDSVPFLIELRKCDTRNILIKRAVEAIMADSDCSMPENWITHNLESGNAILLVDGFDEVKSEDRDEVLNWIEDQARLYPKIRIVVTSRPQVGKRINKKFARYRLLPMTREKVDQFLEYWHSAVLIDRLEVDKDEASRYMNKLSVQIDNSESIRRMVTNPLLCAMICALHFKNGSIMSTERNELYDDCCKMLFGNRDGEKEVQAFSHIKLSYEEKKNILSQLAYWMLKNNLVVAKTEQVITRIGHSIAGLRETSQHYHPQELYQYFLERSGILRSPEEGCVDFVHKSFQEYLAAYEIRNQDDWGFIASKAGDINWYETLVLAMGFSNIHDSKLVIERILGKGSKEKNIVIAAACGANAPRLIPELRKKINSKIEEILPPKSIEASERLSEAGEFVVPYLRCSNSLSSDERYFSINTLRMISSTQALVAAGTYLNSCADKQQIETVGSMLEAYTRKEIQSVNFEKTICEYLKAVSGSESLYIPESFLRILWTTPLSIISEWVSGFSNVTIVNFQNRISRKLMSLFTGLKSLTLIGNFESISSIKDISGQIVSLELCDYSKHFDFYELNRYEFTELDRLYLYSNRKVYINGYDCKSLTNVSSLGLHLYDPLSELYFDGFCEFSRLKSLSLFHEDASELDYRCLVDHSSLEELTIKAPKFLSRGVLKLIKQQVSFISTVTVKYDDDPFVFRET